MFGAFPAGAGDPMETTVPINLTALAVAFALAAANILVWISILDAIARIAQ